MKRLILFLMLAAASVQAQTATRGCVRITSGNPRIACKSNSLGCCLGCAGRCHVDDREFRAERYKVPSELAHSRYPIRHPRNSKGGKR